MSSPTLRTVRKVVQDSSHLRLPPLPSPRDLIKLYKLQAKKQLSQNFLLEGRLTDKIAKAAGNFKNGDVCEVGPGPGSITRSILRRDPGRLLVVEKDPRFLPFLQMVQEASQGKLNIVLGDILSVDMCKMFRDDLRMQWDERCPNIHIIGNLPFSVSTPLIIQWLKDISLRKNAWSFGRVRMTLTFQKEVAERIVAEANGNQRCRLSVMCQNWCDVRHVFTIPGSAFVPPPDVDVGVVTFRPKIEPIIKEDFHLVEKVVRQMTIFRQKKCIRSAETLFPTHLREEMATKLLHLAEVNQNAKPFQLTLDEFKRIVSAYNVICQENPKLSRYQFYGKKSDEEFWQANETDEFSVTNNMERSAVADEVRTL
ncbi:Dimethyladenosine transferase 1, mitochondrial [Frankliniella fusca]|uniref:rRNA adenine N(6)-methyltransferase n=1 Tax=Frankliniella fusca TaxID=407009 RepID=A0AAE1HI48_9NEOP|nr:Dimethyladenosine transferase 1, mitochondrial [Frankliniella fusca]